MCNTVNRTTNPKVWQSWQSSGAHTLPRTSLASIVKWHVIMYVFCINDILGLKCGTEEQGKLHLIIRRSEDLFSPECRPSIDEIRLVFPSQWGCSFFCGSTTTYVRMSILILAPAHITYMLMWSIICVRSGETSRVSASSSSTADRCR